MHFWKLAKFAVEIFLKETRVFVQFYKMFFGQIHRQKGQYRRTEIARSYREIYLTRKKLDFFFGFLMTNFLVSNFWKFSKLFVTFFNDFFTKFFKDFFQIFQDFFQVLQDFFKLFKIFFQIFKIFWNFWRFFYKIFEIIFFFKFVNIFLRFSRNGL